MINKSLISGIPGMYWSGATSSGCSGFGYWYCAINEPVNHAVIPMAPFSPKILPTLKLNIALLAPPFFNEEPSISFVNFICEDYS
jgi:hypothetical protein